MGHIRRLNSREIEAILRRYGFELVGQRGGHHKFRNGVTRAVVTVPEHGQREVPWGRSDRSCSQFIEESMRSGKLLAAEG